MSRNEILKFNTAIKRNGGKPTVYTPELADEICHAVSCSSKGIKRLCEEHKHWPSHDAIYRWIYLYPEFHDLYARAKVVQITVLVDEMFDIIDKTEDVNRARLTIDTIKWLACKLVPKIYGNKVETNVEIGLSHANWIEILSSEAEEKTYT